VADMLFLDNPQKRVQGSGCVQRSSEDNHMKRVLVVEEDNFFRQSLALVLKWYTALKESVEANSLAEARHTLADSIHKPDLAVVALDLASADGFELIEELRTSAPDVAVLAITLRPDAERRERALRAGAGEVLTMAASLREIVDVAKRLVGE
jgi:DNA-binding NarL/FixJ family response regulator